MTLVEPPQRAKPTTTTGRKSRDETILALWQQGYDTAAIARQLAIAESIVANLVAQVVSDTEDSAAHVRRYVNKTHVIQLAMAGYTPAEIAIRVQASQDVVRNCLSAARRRGIAVPKFGTAGLWLSDPEWQSLETAAKRYGTDAQRLAHMVLAIVIRDDLFAAVIDDEQLEDQQKS